MQQIKRRSLEPISWI